MRGEVILLFDLDGTITDPLLGISRSLNFALHALGFEEVEESRVAEVVGPPLDVAFRRLAPGVSEKQIDELVASYRHRYGEIGYAEAVVYPGVAEALRSLAESGVAIGVCTSKRADFAERVLQHFDLRHFFSFVSGGEVRVTKDRQILALLEAGSVTPEWLMVGDRGVDMEAARLNGLRAVGVLWGYGTEEELQMAGAERCLSRPVELLELGMVHR